MNATPHPPSPAGERSSIIPFDQIRDLSLAQADRLLCDWFPNGKRVGREFKVGNIAGDRGESLSINLNTGRWADFEAGIGGPDLIGVRACMKHGGDRTAAARELGPMLGIRMNGRDASTKAPGSQKKHDKGAGADVWRPIVPPPANAPQPRKSDFEGYDQVYDYRSTDGALLFYIRRREARNGDGKLFHPLVFGELNGQYGWHNRHAPAPRPLYGLDRLAAAPDATVIICEGEKACVAAQHMFPDYACVTWPGGALAVGHVDLTPLRDRGIIVWPDNDQGGHAAAMDLRRALPQTRVLQVSDLPEGHDAADLNLDDPDAWLRERLPPPPPEPDASTETPIDPLAALGIWDAGTDDYSTIPPREWLLGNTFCKGFLSQILADGGVGKTSLRMAQIGSCVTGRKLTGEHVHRRSRWLILSFEDGEDELRRRVYASMLKHGIEPADLKGWLFLAAPKGLKLARSSMERSRQPNWLCGCRTRSLPVSPRA
jgi:AAA domain